MKKLLLTLGIFSCFMVNVEASKPGTYDVDPYGIVTIGSKSNPAQKVPTNAKFVKRNFNNFK